MQVSVVRGCVACASIKSASFVEGHLDSSHALVFMDYPGYEICSCAAVLAGLCVRAQSSMFVEWGCCRIRWEAMMHAVRSTPCVQMDSDGLI